MNIYDTCNDGMNDRLSKLCISCLLLVLTVHMSLPNIESLQISSNIYTQITHETFYFS